MQRENSSVLHLFGALQFSKHFDIYDPVFFVVVVQSLIRDSL